MGDNKKLTVLSLFDGIGGGMLALNRAGVEIDKYYASEVDKYAIQVAKGNFPEIIEVGDIAKLSYNKKTEELITENGKIKIGKIDLLIGGSPCQGFTFAGKRQGATTKAKVEKTKDGENVL